MRGALAICLILAGCGPFPAFDVGGDADRLSPPALVPLEQLIAAAPVAAPPPTGDIAARVAALRNRAAGLRGAVIAQPVRTRMTRGVAVPPAIR